MGTDTLQANRVTNDTVQATDVNEFRSAFIGTLVPRDPTTRAKVHDQEDCGAVDARWLNGYFKNIYLNGVLLSTTALKATGVDFVVDAAGGGDYTTITAAITAATTSPAVILVLDGVYTEDLNINKDKITLYGQGYDTKLEPSGGTITISGSGCIFEKFNLSGGGADQLSVSGSWNFIEKTWIDGDYLTNLSDTGTNNSIDINYY